MSFLTQRLANRFPVWSKVRRDPSSMGQRWLSTFAKYRQFSQAATLRMQDEFNLLKWMMGPSHIWILDLEDADYIPLASGPGGGRIPTYHTTVQGTVGVTPYVLTRYETLEGLLNALPTRFSPVETVVGDYDLWESVTPTVFNPIPRPSRLVIDVDGSVVFKKRTRVRNRLFEGFAGVILTGTDENDIEFQETVIIPDDGLFETRNVFKTLTDVQYDGFDGTVAVYWTTASLDFVNDRYNVAVLDDLEGPLRMSWRTENITGTDYTFLQYETQRFKRGDEYRDGANTEIDNTEALSETALLSSGSLPYVAVDLAIDPRTTRLFVLDDANFVHVYEHAPSTFAPPSETLTVADTHVETRPLQHYVPLGATHKAFTHHSRLRAPIQYVIVKRVSPAAVTEYLQANKTWAGVEYRHFYEPGASAPEESWRDLTFDSTYDQLGQWEYYTTTATAEEITTSYTAVMVDSLVALTSLDIGVPGADSISFSSEDYLQVSVGTTVSVMALHSDGYLADAVRQRLVLREEYDSVDVTV